MLRKPKWEASSRVKNRHRSLSRIYKGPGETRSTLRPNLPRDSKLKSETPVPRTARARTTAAPRTTRLVALTLRQGRRHLWQAKRATLHLRHNDRVKKVRHDVRFRILFHFLFLSLATGTGKGDTPKGILLHEGNGLRAHYWSEVRRLAPRKGSIAASGHSGSAPTTDQGFVGWPPKGSTAALEHAERGMTLGTFDT
jgi:hypothetical protein